MATITQADLESVFKTIDVKLDKMVDLYIIGGASAILGYGIVKQTDDVDLDSAVEAEIYEVFSKSAGEVGVDVHLSHKGVFTPPDGYRERMQFRDFPNKKLRVWILDQYDFAISKVSRGFGKDYDDITEVHKAAPYDYAELIRLFMTEFIDVSAIGNKREIKMNFMDLIDKLFGNEKMAQAKQDIQF